MFVRKTHFLKMMLINIALFALTLSGAEVQDAPTDEKNTSSDISYDMLDVTKFSFSNLMLSKGFGINPNGNILFLGSKGLEAMFLDDGNTTSTQDFSNYQIPKIYIRNVNLEDIKKIATSSQIKIPQIFPIVSGARLELSGECKNSTCLISSNIEKKYIQAIGKQESDDKENGLMTPLATTINAQTLLAIGGSVDYSDGMQNSSVVSANKVIAIGGNKIYARGFVNSNALSVANLLAIGGSGLFAVGVENEAYKSLEANSIIAVGGSSQYAYGIYNGGTIRTNFLSATGGKGVNNGGVYNKGEIQADVIVAIGVPNSGVGIFNEGERSKIDVKTLLIASKNGYEPVANYGGTIKALDIYLLGGNAIDNRENGTITTQNLFINDFSTIKGNIAFDPTTNSLLSFNLHRANWKNTLPYLQIKEGNLTLLKDTNIEVNFSDKSILENNLSYDTPYHLVSIVGKGELIDNRADKNIKFLGLSKNPSVKIDKKGIAFAFIKEGISAPAKTSSPSKTSPSQNPSSPEKPSSIKPSDDFDNFFGSVSPKAPQIFKSLIQANANGNKFQEVAISEGISNIHTHPQLLVLLVKEVDKTFQDASVNVGHFSQRTIEYVAQKISDRINARSFEQQSFIPTFSDLIRKNALASNDDKIIMPDIKKDNSVWLNIGGSYYQNASASLSSFSAISLNTTIGYDRALDMGLDRDFVLGGLFNYAKSFYYQNAQKQALDIFTLGAYFHSSIDSSEIDGVVSTSMLLNEGKISNQKIGIFSENYENNNLALNIEGFYKYRFFLTQQHALKPLFLANYTFLYTPRSDMKTFILEKSYDHIFALGAGGEYSFESSFMKHYFQFTGRYHITEINKNRPITFRGAQIFINYDLNPSRVWFKFSYGAKFSIFSNIHLEVSLSSDVSTSKDFLGTGNLGATYIF